MLALDKAVAEAVKAAFADGQTRFTRAYRSNNLDGSMITLSAGVFASIDDLRVVMEKTLRETVDKALDDSSLRAALQL